MLSGKRVSFNLFGWASNIVDYFMP
jgi:hypothetical protein